MSKACDGYHILCNSQVIYLRLTSTLSVVFFEEGLLKNCRALVILKLKEQHKKGRTMYINLLNKKFGRYLAVTMLALMLVFSLYRPVLAATTPDLGEAESFAILSSTYTNTVAGTTINGDLGYTTGPAEAPTVNGTTFSPPDTKYSTAGTDQGAALVDLNNQPCDFSYASGPIDLAADVTTPDGVGQFTPGVYCIDGAASVGAGGITLTGEGTYIFRMDGALTTAANSEVTLAGGASSCDVFWTPTAATTLGANSTFAGTDIDDSGITIGSTVTWEGRALSFGGTVSTDTDTITAPTCATTSDDDDDGGSSDDDDDTVPGLPDTGISPEDKNNNIWKIVLPAGIVGALAGLYLARRRHIV